MELKSLLDWVEADIGRHGQSARGNDEFPLTTMSRSLAAALDSCIQHLGTRGVALDVGSGCGIHGFQLSMRGFQKVQGIERCEEAISCASERWTRLTELPGAQDWVKPDFIYHAIEAEPLSGELAERFDLMVFNPPSFFSADPVDFTKPLPSGLYTGTHEATGRGSNPLQDYFELIVEPLLAPGGISLCTWPGIQERQVTDGGDIPLHPAQVLGRRLGWKISGAGNLSADEFYQHSSVIAYGGRPESNLRKSIHLHLRDHHYSRLVRKADHAKSHLPTFAFGILALKRLPTDRKSFEILDLGETN